MNAINSAWQDQLYSEALLSPGPCTANPFFLSAILSTDALFHGDCPLVPKYALPVDIFHRQ